MNYLQKGLTGTSGPGHKQTASFSHDFQWLARIKPTSYIAGPIPPKPSYIVLVPVLMVEKG